MFQLTYLAWSAQNLGKLLCANQLVNFKRDKKRRKENQVGNENQYETSRYIIKKTKGKEKGFHYVRY